MNYEKHEFNIFPTNENDYKNIVKNMRENGYDITLPIIMFEGKILDGWNRYKASEEVGIKAEAIQFNGSREDALLYSIRTNKDRRHLGSSQLATLAVQAEPLFKAIEEETRKKQREKQREASIGNDSASKNGSGKKLPEPFSGSSNMPKENKKESSTRTAEKVAEIFNTNKDYINHAKKLKEESPEKFEQVMNGEKNFSEIKKEEKKEKKEEERKQLSEIGKNKKIEIDFRLGDFSKIFKDIKDGSIDCIITDPPYPFEYINCWSELSKFAKRVLKPNGFCIAYSGQMHLPEVIKRMSENLDYYWTFAVYHEGQTQIVNGVNLICRWKPVLIFQNGKRKIGNTIQDYFISKQREKDGHDWQQSESGVSYLIERFTEIGDTILDPFAGSGTTIKASLKLGRKIIASEINEQTYNIAKAGLNE